MIGSFVGYCLVADDVESVLQRLSDPDIRIDTVTVTGYNLDAVTGRFDTTSRLVQKELRRGGAPSTAFGLLVEALARRRERDVPPCSVVSCDNIQGNGHVMSDAVTGFARLRDPGVASWIADRVRFPNSMVDRITPQTTDHDRAELARQFGVEDRWPVVCEPYAQWVLEDNFAGGRPPLEDVGMQLVHDVEPYKLDKAADAKRRPPGARIPGVVAESPLRAPAAADPALARFLLDYMLTEAVPTLRPVPGIDLPDYAHELLRRFPNPEVRDTVARLCANTSDLIPTFLLPVARAQLATGRPVLRSIAVIAFRARYVQGRRRARWPLRRRRRAGGAPARRCRSPGPGPHRLPERQPRPVRRPRRPPGVHRAVRRSLPLDPRPGGARDPHRPRQRRDPPPATRTTDRSST